MAFAGTHHPVGVDEALSTLFGIGVGPGDPELVTIKAARLIGELPVLASIGADGRPSRARTIVAGMIPPGTTEISADMPMRCAPAAARPVYDQLGSQIALHLRDGRSVGFLCEGDPLLYGSFVAIMDRLVDVAPITVVPGITSIAAAAARTRHVLALREEIVTIVPATASTERLEAVMASSDSIAILKVGRHLPRIRTVLGNLGLAEHATIVREVGGHAEEVQNLDDVNADHLHYFSLIQARRAREAR